jgi:hypothetical protein
LIVNNERRNDEMEPAEVAVGRFEPYEPPRVTVVGPFRDLTAGESRGAWADDCSKSWS